MSAYPALDFLRKVEVWQDDTTGTAAGLAVALPDGDATTLARLLARFRSPHPGATADLEEQARYWLIGYRETNPPLTEAQRAELDAVIGRDPQWWPPLPRARVPDARNAHSRHRGPPRDTWVVIAAVLVLLACLAFIGFTIAITAVRS
jgi:hypothetical protein